VAMTCVSRIESCRRNRVLRTVTRPWAWMRANWAVRNPDRPALRLSFGGVRMLEQRGGGRDAMVLALPTSALQVNSEFRIP
jgi:hypothetical protein